MFKKGKMQFLKVGLYFFFLYAKIEEYRRGSMEKEKSGEKKKKKNNLPIVIIILFIIVLLLLLLSLIFSQRETKTSEEMDGLTVGILDCKAESPEEPFFSSEGALEKTHEVKITFRGGMADKLSYNYQGTYESEGGAESVRTNLHASYNIYMGRNGLDQEGLSPTFDYIGEKVQINLFAERDKTLNSITANLFFLNSGEVVNLKKYNNVDLEKIYKKKGFNCTFKD